MLTQPVVADLMLISYLIPPKSSIVRPMAFRIELDIKLGASHRSHAASSGELPPGLRAWLGVPGTWASGSMEWSQFFFHEGTGKDKGGFF